LVEYTRPATWDDVKLLARLLREENVEYALIGGYAIAAHGFNRFSEDVDILVNPTQENTERWIRALSRLPDGAAKELAEDEGFFERDGQYAVRVNDEFTVDVMPAACGHSWSELSRYVEEVNIDGVPIRILGLEGLLLTKEGMRDRDRADHRVLSRALERLKSER
jgi:predicted nucleotidyltransferase